MVSYTGKLVSATEDALQAVAAKDIGAFEDAFERLLVTYRKINESMESMWARSLPQDYLKYRSFIFGTGPKKMNAMFPGGVVYEGVSEEPQYFRGESGANDSIVPTADNLLEITAHMPNNDLTKTLRDFRSYRPKNQREFLAQLEARASLAGVRGFAMEGSARAKALYLLLVDQVREFRNRHWMFTKAYIIERTSYDIATGGSPILQYLPNNLSVVLKVLEESFDEFTAADRQALGTTWLKGKMVRGSAMSSFSRVSWQRGRGLARREGCLRGRWRRWSSRRRRGWKRWVGMKRWVGECWWGRRRGG